MSGLGNELYSGSASFGRAWTIFTAIFSTILGLGCIVGGIYILIRKPWVKTTGTIAMVNGSNSGTCDQTSFQNQVSYSCNLTVDYKYNNTSYTANVAYNGNVKHYVGEQVIIYIKTESDPTNISLEGDPPKFMGIILLLIGVIMMGISWFWVWATQKYKFAAAAQGVAAGASIIKQAL